MIITRRAFLGACLLPALMVTGCVSAKKKIPEGMSEAAFDMGTEAYNNTSQYLDGKVGFKTTGAKIDKIMDAYKGKFTIDNIYSADSSLLTAVFNIDYIFNHEDENTAKKHLPTSRDQLGYVLETGHFPEADTK